MCSQECLAKMKILCLNTVQLLFKDAFDKFSDNLSNHNLMNLFDQNAHQLNKVHQNENFDHKETTAIDALKATTSISDLNNNQQNLTNNQMTNLSNERTEHQMVLCNLMQNLVDTINEQCLKQLPKSMNEKKKRKRKRKRKKSKLAHVSVHDVPVHEM